MTVEFKGTSQGGIEVSSWGLSGGSERNHSLRLTDAELDQSARFLHNFFGSCGTLSINFFIYLQFESAIRIYIP
jgi:hypothetical protein